MCGRGDPRLRIRWKTLLRVVLRMIRLQQMIVDSGELVIRSFPAAIWLRRHKEMKRELRSDDEIFKSSIVQTSIPNY